MVQGGGLGDSGFLGGSFQWWMGQVCDDSTWRENVLNHKFDNAESIKGWGYRYKVRILGMHPMENEILPSEKLKFASVMYGVTDGGGQGGTFVTPAIRPGNFVFGFFMDAHENVPMIWGVLGNNAQTELQGKTELTGGKAGDPISGYAESQIPDEDTYRQAGVGDMTTSRPKNKDAKKDEAVYNMLNSNFNQLESMNINLGGN